MRGFFAPLRMTNFLGWGWLWETVAGPFLLRCVFRIGGWASGALVVFVIGQVVEGRWGAVLVGWGVTGLSGWSWIRGGLRGDV
jgi:hypothetical protein